MKKILPSQYYDKNDGFFLSNEIRFSFGRRRGFMIQSILNHYENAIMEDKLFNGFVFIPANEFQKESSYSFKCNSFKAVIEQHMNKKKWRFLEVESFGVEDGLFFKVDLKALFQTVIPNFKEGYQQYLEKLKDKEDYIE